MKLSRIVIALITISSSTLPIFADGEPDVLRITVTGTRTEKNVDEIPASITVFDLEETRQLGTIELKELFNYEPGVSVYDPREINYRSSAGNRGSTSSGNVSIRGVNKNRILMQQDGVKLPSGFYAVGYDYSTGNLVDYSCLKTIDVLKGPASALYGSDALGGVISFNSLKAKDILSKDDLFQVENSLVFDTNSEAIYNSNKVAGKTVDNDFSYIAVISNLQSNGITPKSAAKEYINKGKHNIESICLNIEKILDKSNKINLITSKFQKDKNITRAEGNLANNYISQKEKVRSNLDRYIFSWEFTPLTENNFIENMKAKAYYYKLHVADLWEEIKDVGFSQPITSDYNLYDDFYGLDLQFSSYLDNHLLTYGLDYQVTENQFLQDKYTNTYGVISRIYDNTTYPIKRSPDTNTERLGIYLQDEVNYGKFDFIAGFRLDKYNLDPTADSIYIDYCTTGSNSCPVVSLNTYNISPNVALTYKLNNQIELWSKYARGFRAPTWWELQASQINLTASTPYQVIPNPDLKSETKNSYEIGFRGNYKKYDFELAVYYDTYKNFINTGVEKGVTIVDGVEVDTRWTDNVAGARIWGIEFENEYSFTPNKGGLSLVSSASYTLGQDLDNDIPLDNIDPFKFVTGIKYQNFKNNFSSELIGSYVGKTRRKDNDTGFWPDPYLTFDFLTKFKPKKSLDLYFGIYNLFDKTFYKSANITSNQSSVGVEQFSEPGRHLKLGLKYIF